MQGLRRKTSLTIRTILILLLKGIAATNKKRVFAGSEGMGKKMTPVKQFNMDQRIE